MKVKSFKSKWYKMKQFLTEKDFELFYDVIDIENTVGRSFNFSIKQYNPRYMVHWFPTNRCHWAVFLPLYILNEYNITGDYAVITNEKHSAIINTKTQEIYDPTYDANGRTCTLEQFSSGYEIQTIIEHAVNCGNGLFERLMDFIPKEQKQNTLKILEDVLKKKKLDISPNP